MLEHIKSYYNENNLLNNDQLIQILENTSDLISTSTKDGVITYLNPAGLRMLGFSKESMASSKRIIDLHPQWAYDIISQEGIPSAEQSGSWLGETAIVNSNGDEIPVSQVIIAHKGVSDNQVQFFSTIMRDISYFKNLSKNLKDRAREYKLFTESSVDVVWKADLNMQFTYMSPSVELLLGYTPEEVIDLGPTVTLTPESLQEAQRIFMEEVQKETEYPGTAGIRIFEMDQVHKDGCIKNTEVISNFIRDENGVLCAVCGRTRDITNRINAENILISSKNDLEEIIKLRTQELNETNRALLEKIEENDRLHQEQAELQAKIAQEDKLRTLGLLASTVAHDLNNTLNIMSGYPDILMKKFSDNQTLHRPLMAIKRAAIKSASIVDDLLTLSRRNIVQFTPLNLNKVIGELLDSPEYLQLTKQYPHVHMNTSLCEDLLSVNGSETHLYKAILNLIRNSFEALENIQNPNISISTKNATDENFVVLSISDNGKGIDQKDIKRIFDPFYSNKEIGKSGTGLGMTVVNAAISDHNASIDVQSELNKGTTVTLSFPVTTEEIKKENSINISDYSGSGEMILVVDDDESQRDVIQYMLESLNYCCCTASNIEEATSLIKSQPIDLVILDMILNEDENGLECYKHILNIAPDQKAIIVSGFSQNDIVDEAQKLGAGKYLKKPFTQKDFAVAIRSELKKQALPINQ